MLTHKTVFRLLVQIPVNLAQLDESNESNKRPELAREGKKFTKKKGGSAPFGTISAADLSPFHKPNWPSFAVKILSVLPSLSGYSVIFGGIVQDRVPGHVGETTIS
eukprot:g27825.t1